MAREGGPRAPARGQVFATPLRSVRTSAEWGPHGREADLGRGDAVTQCVANSEWERGVVGACAGTMRSAGKPWYVRPALSSRVAVPNSLAEKRGTALSESHRVACRNAVEA
ncbi:hypothetical protein TRVL_07281 [Trypanosoma vivax]|nr:hypothetical protein TRVL_07281 [Trypanosoma vivax]